MANEELLVAPACSRDTAEGTRCVGTTYNGKAAGLLNRVQAITASTHAAYALVLVPDAAKTHSPNEAARDFA